MAEVKLQAQTPKEVELARQDQIVALRCVAKPVRDDDGKVVREEYNEPVKDADGKPVFEDVDIPVLDKDGNPKIDKDGKAVTQKQRRIKQALKSRIKLMEVPKGAHIDCQKAGEPFVSLHLNQWARYKRASAEFHVAKANHLDVTQALMLEIVDLNDMLGMGHASQRPEEEETERDRLVKQLIAKGVILRSDEAVGIADAELIELLGSAPQAEVKG